MRTTVIVIALALPALPLGAAGAVDLRAQDSAAAKVDAQALEKELADLTARHRAAMQAFNEEYRAIYKGYDPATATAEKKAELEELAKELQERDPGPEFAGKFAALAERAKGTEVAANAWLKVLEADRGGRDAPGSPASKAFVRLLADHIASPAMESFAQQLPWDSLDRKSKLDMLKRVKQESPHASVKAAAAFSLASVCMDEGAQAEEKALAKTTLLELERDFGGLKCRMMGATYGELAARTLYELEHLQLGLKLPDFEATDQDGVKFKLSSYAGKVLVIDFWGYW